MHLVNGTFGLAPQFLPLRVGSPIPRASERASHDIRGGGSMRLVSAFLLIGLTVVTAGPALADGSSGPSKAAAPRDPPHAAGGGGVKRGGHPPAIRLFQRGVAQES